VVSGVGRNATTHTHGVFEQQSPLSPAPTAGKGGSVTLKASLVVPPYAPVSFASESNKLGWSVTARIGVSGSAVWAPSFPVAVYP